MTPSSDVLSLAFDSMRDLVLIKGPNSRIIWANRAFLSYYGMTLQELKDLIDGPQSDPDDTLQYVRDDALVFEVREHVDIPAEVVTGHDGTARLFHTIKSPMLDNGRLEMSVGVSRRHEDDDLHVSPSHLEAKALTKPLRLLTSAFPLAVAILDVRGRVVSTSPHWDEAFGAPQAGSEVFFSAAYPDLANVAPDSMATADISVSDPKRVRLENEGGEREYEVRLGPWRYEDGSNGGVMILALDITLEAKRSEELRASNQRFDMVLAGSSAGIWDWLDVNGTEEYWSPRFYELLGYGPGEIEPSLDSFAALLHPDDVESTFALVDDHFTDGVPFDINYRLRTKTGEYRWFRGTGLAARDQDGAPTRMVGSIQDIDDRVEAQLAIKRMNEDLEHFAHLASHDLREPARRQRMLVSLVIDDHGDEMSAELRKRLEAIQTQSDAMLAMVDGFRVLSRFRGPSVELAEVDMQQLATDLVAEVTSDIERVDITIDLPKRLVGYPTLIELLLRNLIVNARRHGSSPLTLALRHRTEESRTIVSVENRWDGDPADINGRVLKPFVGGRNAGGSGLGLAICQRVVEHHRGWIRVNPQKSTFGIEFNLGDG